jgi:hypothetical protein
MDSRIDLTDCTFIIPVKIDHQDRADNLALVLAYLNKWFNTTIRVYETQDNPFHRTKYLNIMANEANTPIIINFDCDVLCEPKQLLKGAEHIRNGYDVVYPYDGTFARVPRYHYDELMQSLSVQSIKGQHFVGMDKKSKPKLGGVVMHYRQSYLEAGGENEKFISWGDEDNERYHRFKTLGYKVTRTEGILYHIDHHIGVDSSAKNPYFTSNRLEWMKVRHMNKEQLKQYISTW